MNLPDFFLPRRRQIPRPSLHAEHILNIFPWIFFQSNAKSQHFLGCFYQDLPKEEKHHEDSESMRSIDTDPTDAPVAPLAVEAAPPPPEVPHPHAPEGSSSSPSALKKTRISLDPADLTLPEKQRQTSFVTCCFWFGKKQVLCPEGSLDPQNLLF